MQLHFADDSQEQPVEIYHKLKLYDEADPNNPSTKKPVGYAALLRALHDAPTPSGCNEKKFGSSLWCAVY